jgi:hypothetical protein
LRPYVKTGFPSDAYRSVARIFAPFHARADRNTGYGP